MQGFLIGACLAVAALIGGGLLGVWRGPTVFDRLVAVAHVTIAALILILLLGYFSGRPDVYLDVALSYVLLAFVLPLVLGRYIEREGE